METNSPVFTKVFIIGLIQFLLTTIVELMTTHQNDASPYVIGYSALIAILTYFGRNLRGQAASVVTAIASSLVSYFNLHSTPGAVDFRELSIQVMNLAATIIGIFSTSPVKSIGYEHTDVIMRAKAQGENLVATPAPPKPDSV
jgi:hypothetical protein